MFRPFEGSPCQHILDPQARLALHLVAVYINFVAAIAYYMMWSGFSPMLMDIGSCL